MAGTRGPDHPKLAGALLRSPVLLVLLAGLYPPVFLASRNWFLYAPSQLWALVLLTPAATLALWLALRAAAVRVPGICRAAAPRAGSVAGATRLELVAALLACLIDLFLLQSTIFSSYDPPWLIVAMVLVISAGTLLLVRTAGLATLNVVLAVMVVLAAIGWVQSHRGAAPASAAPRQVASPRFTARPNVYLVHLESYHSPEAMEAIYGFDNREFLAGLDGLGFTVFPRQYANYSFTMASLAAIFGMRHHHYQIAAGNDDALGVREMIGGKTHNPVLRAFLDNGYACQLVHPTDYAFIAGDDWDYVHPERRLLGGAAIYQSNLLNRALARMAGLGDPKAELGELLAERVDVAAAGAEPWFSFLEPEGVSHSPLDKRWTDLKYWETEYPRAVQVANRGILRLAERIVRRDPGAVVVMYGDHGAWRYRGIWSGPQDLRQLEATLRKAGVGLDKLALDIFGTFLAVRYPGGDAERFREASHVNLFRVLFAGLSGDDPASSPLAEDASYLFRNLELYRVVRDGKPLDRWQRVDRVGGALRED